MVSVGRRAGVLAVIALSLFALTCAYRFMTMGGRLGGFDNDDYVVLSYAQQMALGDRPIRDYFEPGRPLQHLYLAVVQEWFGRTLLSQFAASVAMIALSTAVLFLIAARASGSIGVGLAVAVVQILMAPRFYNYPKVLAYAAAIPAIWWYIDRPDRLRLLLVAAAGVFAFLLRHDHGAYVAVAGVTAVLVTRWPRWRDVGRDTLSLGVMALLLVAPYLIYAEWHQNLVGYVVASIKFGERDAGRTSLHELPRFSADLSQPLMSETVPTLAQPPRINVRWAAGTDDATRAARERALGLLPDNPLAADAWRYTVRDWSATRLAAIVTDPLVVATDGIDRSHMALERPQGPWLGRVLSAINRTQLLPGLITEQNAIAFLYYAIVMSPLVTLGLIFWRPRLAGVRPWNRASAKMMVVAVLALVMIAGLVRSNVGARLVDVSEVSGVIVAWLAGLLLARSTRRGRVAAVSVAIVFLLVTAVSVQAIEQVTVQLAGIGLDTGRQGMLRHARDVHRVLSAVPPVAAWDRSDPGIVELASYINRCTQPGDRVVVLGYVPELYFLSQRGFGAGSAWISPGFFDSDADQRLMIARIESHRVPIVLTVPDPEYTEDYVAGFPVLHQFLARDYQEAGEVDSDPHYRMRVLVRRSLPWQRHDPVVDLPCFTD